MCSVYSTLLTGCRAKGTWDGRTQISGTTGGGPLAYADGALYPKMVMLRCKVLSNRWSSPAFWDFWKHCSTACQLLVYLHSAKCRSRRVVHLRKSTYLLETASHMLSRRDFVWIGTQNMANLSCLCCIYWWIAVLEKMRVLFERSGMTAACVACPKSRNVQIVGLFFWGIACFFLNRHQIGWYFQRKNQMQNSRDPMVFCEIAEAQELWQLKFFLLIYLSLWKMHVNEIDVRRGWGRGVVCASKTKKHKFFTQFNWKVL